MTDVDTRPIPNTSISWEAIGGVQPIVYVARRGGRPLAILELQVGSGFRLTSCAGEVIGDYATLDEGQLALTNWLSSTR